MVPIDPILSELIDSLAAGESHELLAELAQEWQEQADRLRSKLESAVDYFSDPQEEQEFLQLREALASLDEAAQAAGHGRGDPDELLRLANLVEMLRARILDRRRQHTRVALPTVDDLIRVSEAALRGDATDQSVLRRIAPAQQAVRKLRALFDSARSSFPSELARGVERGFSELDLAFVDLEAYRNQSDDQHLRRAAASLQVGGGLVSLFSQASAQFQQAEDPSFIPLIGPLLQALEMDWDPADLALLKNRGCRELREMWEAARDTWVVPASQSDALQQAVDSALLDFESAVPRAELEREAFWKAVEALSRAFEELAQATLPIQELLGSTLGPEASLVLGLLEDHVPLHQAQNAVEAMRAAEGLPFLEQLADLLELYMESLDKKVLLRSLELLLATDLASL